MNKCYRISWGVHGVGNTVGDSLLPFKLSVKYFFYTLQKKKKSPFISSNIQTKKLQSSIHCEKLRDAEQVITYNNELI
jgi:hypothetical protein